MVDTPALFLQPKNEDDTLSESKAILSTDLPKNLQNASNSAFEKNFGVDYFETTTLIPYQVLNTESTTIPKLSTTTVNNSIHLRSFDRYVL